MTKTSYKGKFVDLTIDFPKFISLKDPKVIRAINEKILIAASESMDFWRNLADRNIKSSRKIAGENWKPVKEIYKENIRFQEIRGPYGINNIDFTVGVPPRDPKESWLAQMIEFGNKRKSFSMVPGLLSRFYKQNTKGERYRYIPFRMGLGRFRTVDETGKSIRVTQYETRSPSGIWQAHQAIVGLMKRMSIGKTLTTKEFPMIANPNYYFHRVVSGAPSSYPMYHNLIRYASGGARGGFKIFRTVHEKHEGKKWTHPGWEGKKLGEQVRAYFIKAAEQYIAQIFV